MVCDKFMTPGAHTHTHIHIHTHLIRSQPTRVQQKHKTAQSLSFYISYHGWPAHQSTAHCSSWPAWPRRLILAIHSFLLFFININNKKQHFPCHILLSAFHNSCENKAPLSSLLSPFLHTHDYHPICITALNKEGWKTSKSVSHWLVLCLNTILRCLTMSCHFYTFSEYIMYSLHCIEQRHKM